MPHPANNVGPLKVRHLTVELTDRLTICQTGYLVILLEDRQTVAAIISRLTLIGQVAVEAHFKMGNSNFIYEAPRRALYESLRCESGKVYAGRRVQQYWLGHSCELLCGSFISTYSIGIYICIIG